MVAGEYDAKDPEARSVPPTLSATRMGIGSLKRGFFASDTLGITPRPADRRRYSRDHCLALSALPTFVTSPAQPTAPSQQLAIPDPPQPSQGTTGVIRDMRIVKTGNGG